MPPGRPYVIRELIDRSWRVLLLSVLAGLVAGASSAGLLAYINTALVAPERAPLAYAALCLLVLASGILADVLLVRLSQDTVFELRMWLARRILAAPYALLQRLGRHRLMATLTEDIESITHAYEAFSIACVEGAIVLATLAYLAWLSGPLFLGFLAFLSLGVASYCVPQSRALLWLGRARESQDALYQHFRALTEGVKELKMHGRRRADFLDQELSATAGQIRGQYARGWIIYLVAMHWGKLLFFVAIGGLLFVLPGFGGAPREVVSGYVLAVLFLMGPLSTITHALAGLSRGLVALRKIESLGLAMVPEEKGAGAGIPSGAGPLALIGISYRYGGERDDHPFTLGPLDLVIEPGELVFLCGGNGSGKTTLALLIAGLYVPDRGAIRLAGLPITDANRADYRERCAAVFADAYVFGGLPEEQAADAGEWLAELDLAHKIRLDRGRFSTVDLSQGQRKRLSLLAAFLDDRPLYLFDEWAAEQDPVFKDLFYTVLLPRLKARGKTVIVITHDDRYFPIADRRVELVSGQIGRDVRVECPAPVARARS
jgi:putative ATP-binding cassette transporter